MCASAHGIYGMSRSGGRVSGGRREEEEDGMDTRNWLEGREGRDDDDCCFLSSVGPCPIIPEAGSWGREKKKKSAGGTRDVFTGRAFGVCIAVSAGGWLRGGRWLQQRKGWGPPGGRRRISNHSHIWRTLRTHHLGVGNFSGRGVRWGFGIRQARLSRHGNVGGEDSWRVVVIVMRRGGGVVGHRGVLAVAVHVLWGWIDRLSWTDSTGQTRRAVTTPMVAENEYESFS